MCIWWRTRTLLCCCSCCWVPQSCPTLCNLMDCSTPGLPVPHHLLELAQVHIHCISDAVQPSHPLMPSSPSVLNLSQHQGLFQWVYLPQMTKILELQHPSSGYSGLISFRNLLVWSPCCPEDFQESSLAPQSNGIKSLAFCLLYSPALTTVHDHCEYHSFHYTELFSRVMSLLFNTLSRCVISFLPRSSRLLISWLQSLSTVILESKKRKSVTTSTFPPPAPLFAMK